MPKKRYLDKRIPLYLFLSACVLTFIFFASAVFAAQQPILMRASVITGYDDNTGLNAERKSDWFAQESAGVGYQTLLSKTAKLRLSYDVLNNNYFEEDSYSFLYQNAGAGLDFLLSPNTLLETDYDFIYLYFPENETVSSMTHRARVGLKQRLNQSWLATLGFSGSAREFDERKLREAGGSLSLDTELSESKHSVDGSLRWQVTKKILTRVVFIYDQNDANDQFHDYYDYENYRVSSVTHIQWCKKLRSQLRFHYDRRDYASRSLVDDAARMENDDTYTASASLFYSLNSYLSLGAAYTYREKDSNEPSQSYSGSLTTLGLYAHF